jgi:predicted nucleic acid-binding protein
VERWIALVGEGRATLIGPIRQEILSGIRQPEIFETLRNRLAAFDDLPLQPHDYEEAARLFNYCRSRGIIGTPVDLLICAVADRLDLAIFTTDRDFDLYAKHLSIRLYTAT